RHGRGAGTRQTGDEDERLAGLCFVRGLRIGAFFKQNRESLFPFWNLGEIEKLFAFRIRVGGTPATAAGQSKDFASMEFCFLAIAFLALLDGREITVGIYHVGLETQR